MQCGQCTMTFHWWPQCHLLVRPSTLSGTFPSGQAHCPDPLLLYTFTSLYLTCLVHFHKSACLVPQYSFTRLLAIFSASSTSQCQLQRSGSPLVHCPNGLPLLAMQLSKPSPRNCGGYPINSRSSRKGRRKESIIFK